MTKKRIDWSDWGPFTGVLALVALFAVLVIVLANWTPDNRAFNPDSVVSIPEYPQRTEPLRSVNSSNLTETLIVPTLETPITSGKSAIWCSSLQLAWNRMKSEIAHGPLELRNAGSVTARLNAASQTEADLDAADFYVDFGSVDEGIVTRIQRGMQQRFPDVEPPHINPPSEPGSLIAFAFLKAGLQYTHEYRDNMEPFVFTDSHGRETNVCSFGILPDDRYRDLEIETLRGQVTVLWKTGGKEEAPEEFALDLCRHSTPYQIVLARINRRDTLTETIAEIDRRTAKGGAKHQKLGYEDEILVPNMYWNIDHRFSELEGKDKAIVAGPAAGKYLDTAFQCIQFRLDRRGAEVASAAWGGVANGGPTIFHFNRPFLVYMIRRGAKHPFFAMWVDNAELLQPYRATDPAPKRVD